MKDDFEFRFRGAGNYADHFNNAFWLDENAEYHRDGGPAIKYAEGGEAWMQHGKPHRDGDLPAITDAQGSKGWYQNGELHRLFKPAVENADGSVQFWVEGKQLTPEAAEKFFRSITTAEDVQRGFAVAAAVKTAPVPKAAAPKTAHFSR
ncbi:MAG TPA: hypothetical protein VEF76_08380 [Patescibacteria group bacterium]|nr:hypothetical protein [Patescibacteria group bacterium]